MNRESPWGAGKGQTPKRGLPDPGRLPGAGEAESEKTESRFYFGAVSQLVHPPFPGCGSSDLRQNP